MKFMSLARTTKAEKEVREGKELTHCLSEEGLNLAILSHLLESNAI